MTDYPEAFIHWFREAAPFVNAHRGQTIVVHLGGHACASAGFEALLYDLALINALGVRLVIVHGVHPELEAQSNLASPGDGRTELRVTDAAQLQLVKEAVGATRVSIEASLSLGVSNSPLARKGVKVASGNFVIARPLGVRHGVDFQFTGEVRSVDTAAITALLDLGMIVLISPLGYSATGEVFNLGGRDTAVAVASELQATKLILLAAQPVTGMDGALVRQLTVKQARERLQEASITAGAVAELQSAARACHLGVARAHIVAYTDAGSVVKELFTRDGAGTLVSISPFDLLRAATLDDVSGILDLIEPLEAEGVLVRRSREKLEQEIDYFAVLVREGTTVACGALYPFAAERMGEIACIAVHPDYRRMGFGDAMLARMEQRAKEQGLDKVFVLTTHAAHWFVERGYQSAAIGDLPMARQALYNYQRNSRVFVKQV
jgi:amino-acid N-acetyltransferase